jgi:hypothetical protein
MKHFTSQLVSKWIKKPESITHARGAKPFPGKAPTRIYLGAVAGKRSFRYLGKPSQTIYKEWLKFCKVPVKNVEAVSIYGEFDRGGLVHLDINSVGGWNPGVRKTNIKLWQLYHPEVVAEADPTWLKWPYKATKGVYRIN